MLASNCIIPPTLALLPGDGATAGALQSLDPLGSQQGTAKADSDFVQRVKSAVGDPNMPLAYNEISDSNELLASKVQQKLGKRAASKTMLDHVREKLSPSPLSIQHL